MLTTRNKELHEEKQTQVVGHILDVSEQYDCYFFDAYGVFWNGSKIMDNAIEEMKELKKQGKNVVVLSNTTQLHDNAEKSYDKRGLKKGEHYDLFITSGDVFKSKVLDGSIQNFINQNSGNSGNKQSTTKIYVHGAPNAALFENSNFEIVDSLDKADAVYLSIPQYTKEELEKLGLDPEKDNSLKKSNLTKEGQPERWDSINLDVFKQFLNECLSKGLPILNANPDASAPEKERGTDPVIINDVVRNGQLTQYYAENGGKVFECGKPNLSTYEYALDQLATQDKSPEYLKAYRSHLKKEKEKIEQAKKRMIMIGDTIGTDIQGAKNFRIDSALVATGNFSKDTKNQTEKEKINTAKNSGATYFLSQHGQPLQKLNTHGEKGSFVSRLAQNTSTKSGDRGI